MDLKLKNNNKITLKDFEKVDYIQNTGFPNINTGIEITSNSQPKIECDIEVVSVSYSNTNPVIYGIKQVGAYTSGLSCNDSSGSNFTLHCKEGQTRYYNNSVSFSGRVKIIHTYSGATINGEQISRGTSAGSGYNASANLMILPSTNTGSIIINIYSYKVYNSSNVLIRDYIPAISYEVGHFGEPCLYDRANAVFYYAASTGSFTASGNCLYSKLTTAFITNCPGIASPIGMLRLGTNLTNVHCTIGEVSGTVSEVQHYATLHGFNANEEPDNSVPATINGTITIVSWHTNAEIAALQGVINGLTVVSDGIHCVEDALENEDFAVQTLDSTKANYNPAVAIKLHNAGQGFTISTPIVNGGGRYLLPKSDVAAITSVPDWWFSNVTTLTDANAIVTNDNTATYNFTTFNEFKYWTGVRIITASFYFCSLLTSIELPEGMTEIKQSTFRGTTALSRIVIPSTITRIYDTQFDTYSDVLVNGNVYFNGTLSQWMNITFNTQPCGNGVHFYINNEEVTEITVPSGVTQIKERVFKGMKYVTSIILPNTVTSIQARAFQNCSELADDFIYPNITSIGDYALNGCSKLKNVDIRNANIRNFVIAGSSNGTYTLKVKAFTEESLVTTPLRFKNVLCYGSYTSSVTAARYFLVAADRNNSYAQIIRLKGSYSVSQNSAYITSNTTAGHGSIKFLELMGTYTSNYNNFIKEHMYNPASGNIVHLGYTGGIALTPSQIFINNSYLSKVYVGDGSSYQSDSDVFDLYNADSNWSAYCGSGVPGDGKVDLWWNYNGEYRTYRVQESLTGCTNSNSVVWPHITRGESYTTTIVPNEGLILGTVTVEMYDAQTDGVTPSTPTDITSTAYDIITGEINIPSVTGNIIITATAS